MPVHPMSGAEKSSHSMDMTISEDDFRNLDWTVDTSIGEGLSRLRAEAGGIVIAITVEGGDPRLEMATDSGGRVLVEDLDPEEAETIAWELFDDFVAEAQCPAPDM